MSSTRFRVNPQSTLYSCLNVKELLARNRREIWSWSDWNWSRAQNHLVRKTGQTGQMIELCSEYLSVRCIWLYDLVMLRTRFRVNPHSIHTHSTLYLAKWSSVCVQTKSFWVRVQLQSLIESLNISDILPVPSFMLIYLKIPQILAFWIKVYVKFPNDWSSIVIYWVAFWLKATFHRMVFYCNRSRQLHWKQSSL